MRVLLVEHVPQLAFPGIADHVAQSLELDFGCSVTRVLPWQLNTGLFSQRRWRLMLVLHGAAVDLSLVDWVRKSLGIRTAVWVTEDPYEIDLHASWPDVYDHVFTNDSATLGVYGRPNVTFLPWCTNPRVFRPMEVAEKYRSDVCVVGQGFPNRMDLLNALAPILSGLRARLVGDWTGWGDRLSPALKGCVVPGAWTPREAAMYFNGARINLNIHRDPSPGAMPNNLNAAGVGARSPNARAFDIAGCGAFQLVDATRPDIGQFFELGREIVLFSDPADLAGKILHYLHHGEERSAIARAGMVRVARQHTYRDRIRVILSTLVGAREWTRRPHATVNEDGAPASRTPPAPSHSVWLPPGVRRFTGMPRREGQWVARSPAR